jgi:uncharacterized Zn-binding protein involved in type VI secretion
MPPAARLNDKCTGHNCFPSRPINSASSNVRINGIRVARVDDSLAVHNCGTSSHAGTIIDGSSTVRINGRKAARIGDPVDCGSLIAQGSSTVFIGG